MGSLRMTKLILFFFSLGFLTAGARILKDQCCSCELSEICLWQYCNVGCESHWVTVVCDIEDDGCNDTFDTNSGRCMGCTNVECMTRCGPCVDIACPGCLEQWEECQDNPLFGPNFYPASPEDPFIGGNCGE